MKILYLRLPDTSFPLFLSIELEELSLPQLIEKFLYLEEHYDKIAACLDKHKITWKEKAEMTYQAIEDTIFSKNTQ